MLCASEEGSRGPEGRGEMEQVIEIVRILHTPVAISERLGDYR